jgi:hypothetical protein
MRSRDMNDEDLLQRYLLGGLDEEQAENLERRLLADGDLFELAEAVEGDLFAATARGELTPAERVHVRRRLAASPEGRARLALARDLTVLDRKQAPVVRTFRQPAPVIPALARPGFRAAVLAASLAVMAGSLWLASPTARPGAGAGIAQEVPTESNGKGTRKPADQITRVTPPGHPVPQRPLTEGAQEPAVEPAGPAEEPRLAEAGPEETPEISPLLFQLALSTVRSSGAAPRLAIPAATREVEIRLSLMEGEPATSFSAVLRNAATGEEILNQEALSARTVEGGKAIVLSVPAAEMSPGTYEVEVRGEIPDEGLELLGRPMFEVLRADS